MLQKFFQQQTPRMQLLEVTAAVVVIAALAGWGVLLPLHGKLAASKIELERSSQSLIAMQELVQSYEAMAEAGAEGTYPGLTAVVNQSLQGKTFQPSRIQQNGAGELVVRVDNVPFQQAVEWIHELENTAGVVVASVAVNQSQSGLVNLTLALTGL
jgi:type II secretory pathway component PulM